MTYAHRCQKEGRFDASCSRVTGQRDTLPLPSSPAAFRLTEEYLSEDYMLSAIAEEGESLTPLSSDADARRKEKAISVP